MIKLTAYFHHDNMTRFLRILAGPPGQAKRHGQCLRALRDVARRVVICFGEINVSVHLMGFFYHDPPPLPSGALNNDI